MPSRYETLIIGGGQAGLSLSYCLTQLGRDHLVLEKSGHFANAWRSERWDSFTLVTPNWANRLPGFEYRGSEPDGYLTRPQIVDYLDQYVASFHPPIRVNSEVKRIEQDSGRGYLVSTTSGTYRADNVVVATGMFQQPRVPEWAKLLPASIVQLHTSAYRNPDLLPPGAVLVVGSAQSGCQIADDLSRNGRTVYLSIGSAGRAPRRIRGRDAFWWLNQVGFLDRPVAALPSPAVRFAGNPHLTGRDGGRTINLHQFVRDGIRLLGRATGFEGSRLVVSPDLKENLTKADAFAAMVRKLVDDYCQQHGLDMPLTEEDLAPEPTDGFGEPVVESLDLAAAEIGSVVWAAGYRFDFGFVGLPVFDSAGFPAREDGATSYQGLYFHGIPWMPVQKTGLFLGIGDASERLAAKIAG